MNLFVSPSYQMKLIEQISENLLTRFPSNDEVRFYLKKWHETEEWPEPESNFYIYNNEDGTFNYVKTLHSMDGELLLKIAVDLGITTPDFIPTVAVFKNEIKSSYSTAYQTFEKAVQEVYEHPDIAIGLANSALESILKEICKDGRVAANYHEKHTLYDLSQTVLKGLGVYPNLQIPVEIKDISSGLLKVCQQIEKLRSSKTKVHGKTGDDEIVDEPLFAHFVVNTAATLGLFLINFYKRKFPPSANAQTKSNDLEDLLNF